MSPLIRLVLGAIAISFTGVFAQLADVTGAQAAFWRTAYSVPLLVLVFVAVRRRPIVRLRIAAVGLLEGVEVVAYHVAVDRAGVAVPTLVVNLQVAVVAVGAAVMFGERVRKRTGLGLGIALIGLVLVIAPGSDADGTSLVIGALIAAAAATAYGGYLLGLRAVSSDDTEPLDVIASVTPSILLVTAIGAAIDDSIAPPASFAANAWLIALAVTTPVLGWILIASSINHVRSTTSSSVLLIQPALATLWGITIFDESTRPIALAGLAITLIGVAIAASTTSPPADTHDPGAAIHPAV